MASRWKMVEIKTFFKNVKADYKTSSKSVSKEEKKKCFKGIITTSIRMLWGVITAPFIYPIWYLFRKQITKVAYKGTSWQEVLSLMQANETVKAKELLKANGSFIYWLWTYGDCDDPLGWGGMPKDYLSGKNTFYNRFRYSALRNPRFNVNYMDFRTGRIVEVSTVIDNRDFYYMHKSRGIGDSPDGIYFKWMKDNNGKWYFIYEDNNVSNIFYFGYVGLLNHDVGNSGGRFETSYRVTESSYYVK